MIFNRNRLKKYIFNFLINKKSEVEFAIKPNEIWAHLDSFSIHFKWWKIFLLDFHVKQKKKMPESAMFSCKLISSLKIKIILFY